MKKIKSKSSTKRLLTAGIIAAVVALVAVVLWWQGDRLFPASDSNSTISENNLPSTPDPTALIGQWIRLDGGYVIRIESLIAPDKLTATYFNPNPIHVSQASYTVTDRTLSVFVELQDTGYPGCTYNLTYDAATDALVGDYYQAAMKETYQIAFSRKE